jgi:hypothetical protein
MATPRDVIANQFQIVDLLKFHPDWVKDEVPPWVLFAVDKTVLRDLALVSLERSKAIAELNVKAINEAAAIIRKAQF